MEVQPNDYVIINGKAAFVLSNLQAIDADGNTVEGEPDFIIRDSGEAENATNYCVALPVLEYGSSGIYVWIMQALLLWHRYLKSKSFLDGSFGMVTYEALRAFRADHYLDGDTVTDAATWQELLKE